MPLPELFFRLLRQAQAARENQGDASGEYRAELAEDEEEELDMVEEDEEEEE